MTELTSNTATVTAVAPVIVTLAEMINMDPMSLLIPIGLAGSCAFMLPVATPPNAIVYASKQVTIRDMMFGGNRAQSGQHRDAVWADPATFKSLNHLGKSKVYLPTQVEAELAGLQENPSLVQMRCQRSSSLRPPKYGLHSKPRNFKMSQHFTPRVLLVHSPTLLLDHFPDRFTILVHLLSITIRQPPSQSLQFFRTALCTLRRLPHHSIPKRHTV